MWVPGPESIEDDVHAPVFGLPGLAVDEVLLSADDPWITCDEFAAGAAALAHYMLTGRPAKAVATPGPGTDLLAPAVEMAKRERAEVLIDCGGATVQRVAPARTNNAAGNSGDATRGSVILVELSDLPHLLCDAASLTNIRRTGRPVVTAHPAVPGARWFPEQWLGHLGYLGHLRAIQAIQQGSVIGVPDVGELPDGEPVERTQILPPGPRDKADDVATALDAVLPTGAPVVCDAGAAHAAVARTIAWAGQRAVCATSGFTTMGWSLGAALGAHVASPGSPVGVMIGDGSLLMRLGDLAVLARYRVPALIVVLVNGLLGDDRSDMWREPGQRIAELPNVDWVAAVQALGVGVSNNLHEAYSRLDRGPQVVLVPTGQEVGPRP